MASMLGQTRDSYKTYDQIMRQSAGIIQETARPTFGAVVRREALPLLEVPEQLNRAAGLPHRVLAVLRGPHELLRRAEGLVAEGHRRVDDVLAVAAHDDESVEGVVIGRNHDKQLGKLGWVRESYVPSVGIVSDCLGIDFAGSHVLDGHWKPLAVLDFCTWGEGEVE